MLWALLLVQGLAPAGALAQPPADAPPADAPPADAPPADAPPADAPPADAPPAPGPEQEAPEAERLEAELWAADAPRHFVLERVEVRGNDRTLAAIIRAYVPIEDGALLDPESLEIEATEWRLMGTGWFSSVDLSLRRGARRGHVILTVRVEERNTLLIQSLYFGVSEGLIRSEDLSTDLVPYLGASVADSNLFGLGIELGVHALLSRRQQGVRISFTDPHFLRSPRALRLRGFFNNARQYFGHQPLVTVACPDPPEICDDEIAARNAVVIYRRGGFSLGTGRHLGTYSHFAIDWQLEIIDVLAMPLAASESWGSEVRPIDFSVETGRSIVSLLRFAFAHDRRDDPVLPTRGSLFAIQAEAATRFLGSRYDFVRLQLTARQWFPLPGHVEHSLRLGFRGGAVLGDAPFFYEMHAADLSDLIPSRALEMQLDRRAAPNLLGTAVGLMRNEELGARLDLEYALRLTRGRGALRGVDAYVSAGVYALADLRDLRLGIPGYQGFSRIPFDLTFDLGLRADTAIGVFQFGFSNILGFIEL
ncbi:MAG: BamA/TamA family outer membrane protein [Myxococcales bacterium]|nr:BamA/TamA family outer membrane protein [Myxococcales bacterium]